jgi:hypothetical protein
MAGKGESESREGRKKGTVGRSGWFNREGQKGVPEKGGKDAAEDREGLPKRLG